MSLGWMIAFLVYLALLTGIIVTAYMAGFPSEALPPFPFYDTLGHFGLIGFAAFLLELAWCQRKVALPLPGGGRWALSAATLVVGGAAGLEEGLQLLASTRSFDWLDLFANLAGALCFAWAAQFLVYERRQDPSFPAFVRRAASDLLRFTRKMMLALIFPSTIFLALAVTRQIEFPVAGLYRYDFFLLLFLGVQLLLLKLKVESWAELKTITWFHLLGLAMELFKVNLGSWSYPEPALTKLLGVPLYSGFMYASVASFLIQVWHRLNLRLERWPHFVAVMGLGSAIYLNFFTHHFVGDIRWFLILGVFFLFFRTRVVLVNSQRPRAMPLVASFLGLGFFIWVGENLATFLGAWAYPNQLQGWQLVHLQKINSWFLLGIISFMLVAELNRPRQAAAATGAETARERPDDIKPLQNV